MQLSKIGWCDYSGGDLNFVRGCTPVSEGCQHCYARAIYERFGKDFGKVVWSYPLMDAATDAEYAVDSPKRGAPHRPMAFVCDTGDLFHDSVPSLFIHDALTRMSHRRDVTWVVLTKRAERMRAVVNDWTRGKMLPAHIWLGVTAENYVRLHQRLPILRDTPACMRFVSIEPMLGPVGPMDLDKLSWVIVGAESGAKRRPFDVRWAADVKRQCDEAGVPFFGKQDSGLRPGVPLLFDGQECKAWPAK